MYEIIMQNTRNCKTLVESITNYVTVNDSANAILAVGGSPIMGDFYEEVGEIVAISNAVLLNIGQLNENLIKAHKNAALKANELNIPIVFDPVAAGVSNARNNLCEYLMQNINFCVIKGNASEINYLVNKTLNTSGCDSSDEINPNDLEKYIDFAKKHKTILVITGKNDFIISKTNVFMLSNGSVLQTKITGAGCMLGNILAVFVGANDDKLNAVITGISAFNISAEIAENKANGTMSFKMHLIDELSKIDGTTIKERIKIEKLR